MKLILTSLLALGLAGPSVAVGVAVPEPARTAFAQDRVRANRAPRFDPRSSEGTFDINVRVDGEAFVYVKSDEITHLIVSGGPLRVERSTHTQPIPEAVYGRFELEKLDGRGSAELFEAPSRANDYTAILRINDPQGGSDLYHLRLNWTWNPANPGLPPRASTGGFPNDIPDFGNSRSGEFWFEGRVDHITAVVLRGDQVRFEDYGGRRLRNERYGFNRAFPAIAAEIRLVDVRGRGKVEVVEHPWEGNAYTTVIRIEDSSGGDAEYSFGVEWRRR
jgi:hypothetical protein